MGKKVGRASGASVSDPWESENAFCSYSQRMASFRDDVAAVAIASSRTGVLGLVPWLDRLACCSSASDSEEGRDE
jgi:hypothetical protein